MATSIFLLTSILFQMINSFSLLLVRPHISVCYSSRRLCELRRRILCDTISHTAAEACAIETLAAAMTACTLGEII